MVFNLGQIAAFVVGGLGLLLTLLNIFGKLNDMKQSAAAPLKDLEKRMSVAEVKVTEIEHSLERGNKRFDDLDEKYEAFMTSMLAFLDFEIAYCQNSHYEHTEDLIEAKKALRKLQTKV